MKLSEENLNRLKAALMEDAQDGNQYVKSHQYAEELDANSHEIGQLMALAHKEGWVEKWGQSGNSFTWRITEEATDD